MPLGTSILVLGLGLVLLIFKRGIGVLLVAIGFSILLIFSLPGSTFYIVSYLESQFPPRKSNEMPVADLIVVLGGGINIPVLPRTEPELADAADRINFGRKLFVAGSADYLLLTGGNVVKQTGYLSEADYANEVLQEWGVPSENILVEKNSRNTYENAIFSFELFGAEYPSILLVTSAMHMPRAVATFKKAGFRVVPASTDIKVTTKVMKLGARWLPSAGALRLSSDALHEIYGLWLYRLRGWAE